MRAIILLGLLCSLLSAQPREALLIGNKNYSYLENLQNPQSSMKKLKKTLEKLGFHVIVKYDLDAENLSAEVEKFRDRLSSDTIGFFYYSGHGCQINNQSYLIPTNVDTTKPSKVKYHALSIGELLDTLNRANNKLNMLFLDACRDVPIGAKGGKKGLGQISTTPKGTLVVYATEAGKTANDNTLFINKLRETLLQPNQKILDIANNLSNIVASKTSDTQIPEVFFKKLPRRLVLLKGGYVPPQKPVYVPQPVVVKPQTHSSKNIVIIDGLMYQNQPFKKRYTWQKAKEYCEDLTLDGYSNWRLPNRKELKKLVTKNSSKSSKGYTQYIRKEFIENLPQYNWFWSSTEKGSSAWLVFFNDGYDDWYPKTNANYVLCVSGQ